LGGVTHIHTLASFNALGYVLSYTISTAHLCMVLDQQPVWNNALLKMFRCDFEGTDPYITCNPFLHHHRLGPQDHFLVLSSDGLYQYLSNEEVVSRVQWFMQNFPDGDPAQHLIEELLFRAAKKNGRSNLLHLQDICTVAENVGVWNFETYHLFDKSPKSTYYRSSFQCCDSDWCTPNLCIYTGMDFHELLDIPQGDRRKYHDDVYVMVISLEGRIWKSAG
jgi:hypothetical protein